MPDQKKPGFAPRFSITPAIARNLIRIEVSRLAMESLPVTSRLLANLRETARLASTHYSTRIEGNLLTREQVVEVIAAQRSFPGREREQDEVRGYYAALDEVETIAVGRKELKESSVRRLHALVMGAGRTRVKPTPYRDGQNVVQDSASREIVYLPPVAADVPVLMAELIDWLRAANDMPVPLKAAVAHYQFATVHPYYDGNGRTARLLTTLILHLGGYGLKGIFALEEYYARDLPAYYRALSVGPSHNYYLGREEADITDWVAYCIEGMATSFEKVCSQAERESRTGSSDQSRLLRELDPRQRRALTLFQDSREVSAKQIGDLLGFQPRTASAVCQRWVAAGFLVVTDPSRRARRYRLSDRFEQSFAGEL